MRLSVSEVQRGLEQFWGTQAYHQVARNALLTDGAKFLADEVGAYWLFQDTAIYLAGYEKQDEFAVIRLDRRGHWFVVERGNGNGDFVKLFDGEFTDFPIELMPFEFFAQWSEEHQAWVFMLKGEY